MHPGPQVSSGSRCNNTYATAVKREIVLRRSVRQEPKRKTTLTIRPMRQISVRACISLVLVAGPAHADRAGDALSEFARCAGIALPAERLKCFDTAVQGLANPPAKAEGFGKPPPPRPDEVTQIGATVLELAKTARGRAVFILDNGQTWRQIDGDDTDVREPPPGKTMKVTIATGIFNSYNLTIEGRNGLIKVRRLK